MILLFNYCKLNTGIVNPEFHIILRKYKHIRLLIYILIKINGEFMNLGEKTYFIDLRFPALI